mmetsp:Transcript_25292/g.39105  ORF Transcript_25292/g.39105 Transcript_25292/m.39105 type:complete len:99 (+) Transcript_25292:7400-7696(+)
MREDDAQKVDSAAFKVVISSKGGEIKQEASQPKRTLPVTKEASPEPLQEEPSGSANSSPERKTGVTVGQEERAKGSPELKIGITFGEPLEEGKEHEPR